MSEFYEGQEVEVSRFNGWFWEPATIVVVPSFPETKEFYTVRLRDGYHVLLDADHIREART